MKMLTAKRLGIATGDNRINSSGPPPASELPTLGSIPYQLTLQANGTAGFSTTVAALGSSFYISAISVSSALVTIQPTGGDQGSYSIGTGQDFKDRAAFASLTITNPNAFPVTLTLEIGFPEFIDKRLVILGGTSLNIQDAPTILIGTALGAMLAGAATTFTGVSTASALIAAGKTRRQIVVTNNDANLVVAVLDAGGVRVGDVYPQRAWALATSSGLIVKNQNGSGLTGNVDVGETFYS
jgi:hypothetical protein